MNKPQNIIMRMDVAGSDIQFVDLKAQQNRIRADVDAAIANVLAHGRYISGPEIDEFETALIERTGAADIVTCASGTDALLIPMMSEGIGTGDAVFLPAFTYNATANAVLMAGATPVFVDIEPETFNIDPLDLELRIQQTLGAGELKPRAIMAVDLFGIPADYERLKKIAARHDLCLMADAAQSFGASVDGAPVGTLAPITATSFFPSKALGCYGDGGAMFTMDKEQGKLWRSIRFHGTDETRKESLRVGMNGRLDTIQAAILLVKLSIFDDERKACRMVSEIYSKALNGRVGLVVERAGVASSHGLFSMLARDSDDRDRIQSHLHSKGIPTAIYYTHPLHQHAAFRPFAPAEGLPVSEDISTRILSLPMHAYLSEKQADFICEAVLEVN